MNPGALVFLLGAWVFVLGLAFWSFWRLMRSQSGETLPPPGSVP